MSNSVSLQSVPKPIVGVPIPRDYFQREPLWGNAGGYRAVNEIIDAVTESGGVVKLLFPGETAEFDALLLPGGGDVDPQFYGQTSAPEVTETDPELDAFQIALAKSALESGMPILAICRGMQVLNVAAGGSLVQHLESSDFHFPQDARSDADLRARPVHSVTVSADSRLGGVLGDGRMDVNSLHHQAVDTLGSGLKVAAIADDGVVEAIEGPGRFQVAVQFHPEDLRHSDPRFQALFQGLVEAV